MKTILIVAILVIPLLPSSALGFEAEIGHRASTVIGEANKRIVPERPAENRSKSLKPNPSPTTARDAKTDDGPGLKSLLEFVPKESRQTFQTVAIFGLASLAPAGLLMITAFVRINIVLLLLRQALGSPQIPGNQVLTALALMLTFLVMEPIGERIYREAIVPLAAKKIELDEALASGMRPVKSFMAQQIVRTHHQDYLLTLYDEAVPPQSGRAEPEYGEDFPFRVLAPAFLLSELTTALTWGFFLYLPFLVIDLVVSSVLAAMGLFMLPPTSIAMPVKLILFVMADGWLRVSERLLASFATGGSPV